METTIDPKKTEVPNVVGMSEDEAEKTLHEKELVLLKRKSDDRRKIIVSLTEKGEEAIVSKLIVLDNKILKLIEELGVEKSITLIEILNDINQIIVKEKINER